MNVNTPTLCVSLFRYTSRGFIACAVVNPIDRMGERRLMFAKALADRKANQGKGSTQHRLLLSPGLYAFLGNSTAQPASKFRGFTLLEAMVVLAIVAILTTLAVPSFMRLVQTNTMSSNVNTFMADLRFARSESMRRGGGVVMCRSDDPEATNPVCKATSGPRGNGWVSGWIVFLDMNNDVDKAPGELLLRMQSPMTRMDSITENGGAASTKFRFTATGRLFDASSATSLQFGGGEYASDVQRVLCVSPGGRARIAGNGAASCGSDS